MNGRFPPSAKRLREARAEGNVAYSPLLAAAAALAAGTLALALTARAATGRVTALARHAWGRAASVHASEPLREAIREPIREIVPMLSAILLPILLAIGSAALLAGLAQTRGLFAWRALGRPRRDGNGDGDEALPLVAWATALLLALVLVVPLRAVLVAGARATTLDGAVAAALHGLAALAPRALVVLALAGLGDFAWRRARLMQALAMTRAERERERREEEGDPRLRAEQRRRQRAVMRDSLVDDVARAQVVLLAEGLAVALHEVDGTARIAASVAGAGAGDERLRAQRLSAIARRLGLPLRLDDALVEALAPLPSGAPVPDVWQARALTLIRASRKH
jgi:flagellar biosynthesis protein FlhB